MLVLTRKQQEKIRIGDQIVITVLRTKGKAVRLGIEAPAEVPVIRGELSFIAAEDSDEHSTSEAEQPAAVEVRRGTAPAGGQGPKWPTNSDANVPNNRLPGVAPRVSFQRVPREKLAEALPGTANGDNVLRTMLNRRTLSA